MNGKQPLIPKGSSPLRIIEIPAFLFLSSLVLLEMVILRSVLRILVQHVYGGTTIVDILVLDNLLQVH